VLPRPVDVTALEAECERRSVRVYHSQPGVLFLGYANLSEGALAQAVRRLAEAVGEAEA
jgi:hypothetical protein